MMQRCLDSVRAAVLLVPGLQWLISYGVLIPKEGATMTLNDVLGYGQQALALVGGIGGLVALASPFFRGALLRLARKAAEAAEEAAKVRPMTSAQKKNYALSEFEILVPFYLRPFAVNPGALIELVLLTEIQPAQPAEPK